MPQFTHLKPPADGTPIVRRNGAMIVPDDPIIPFIEGDGTGPDIWRASVRIFDAAVQKAFSGSRRLAWFEVLAGEKAKNLTGEWLPSDTLEAVRALQGGHQGTADDAGRRRYPQPERHAAPGARPLRVRAPGPLLPGHAVAGDASGEDERGHLPREHRRRVRRHRVCQGHAASREDHRVPVAARWASASRRTPASASSPSPRRRPSGSCGWRSSTPSTTSARPSRSCTRATS